MFVQIWLNDDEVTDTADSSGVERHEVLKHVCVVSPPGFFLLVTDQCLYLFIQLPHDTTSLTLSLYLESPVQIFSHLQPQFLLHCVLAESDCSCNHSEPISRDFRAQSTSVERYNSEIRFEMWSYMFNMDS